MALKSRMVIGSPSILIDAFGIAVGSAMRPVKASSKATGRGIFIASEEVSSLSAVVEVLPPQAIIHE